MVEAKRAAKVDDDALAPVAELGTVTSARRAFGSPTPKRVARLALAPLAILSVLGLAGSLLFVPPSESADQADPASTSTAALGTSRDLARPALSPTAVTPSPTPSASATPTTAAASPSATASPSSAPSSAAPAATTAAAAPKRAVDYTQLAAEAGTRYASSSLNVRTGPGTDFDTISTLDEGAKVTITEREIDGWRQVVVSKKSGWVKATFLTDKAPTTSTASSSTESSSSGGFSTAACSKAGSLESNLTAKTAKALRAVCGKFDGVSSYGGYRPGAGSYHGSGQAIDVMVTGDYGWEIAKWARANAKALGITEVIYEQKIWTTQRSGDGWRSMSDRGSVSANHYDHVHLSVGG